MAYVSLYRKYRPQTFADVVGQDHVTTTLRNAIADGRVASGYLFTGTRGTAKTTCARIVAKALNCIGPDGSRTLPAAEPCGECGPCRAIAASNFVDVLEMDAASHGKVDDVRDLVASIKFPPMEGRYKIYIIDEAHQLSRDAMDAFLKTLEEPPDRVVFILATTEIDKLPITIASRCQVFEFKRGSVAQIGSRLAEVLQAEGVNAEQAAINLVARAADGSYRDSLSLLEQVLAYKQADIGVKDVTAVLGTIDDEMLNRVVDLIAASDAAGAFAFAGEIMSSGKDIRQFLKSLSARLRDLLFVGVGAKPVALAELDDSPDLRRQAAAFSPDALLQALLVLTEAEQETKRTNQHRLLLEMALLRLMRLPTAPTAAATAPQQPPPTPAARAADQPKATQPPAASADAADDELSDEEDTDTCDPVFVEEIEMGAIAADTDLVEMPLDQANQPPPLPGLDVPPRSIAEPREDTRDDFLQVQQVAVEATALDSSSNGHAVAPIADGPDELIYLQKNWQEVVNRMSSRAPGGVELVRNARPSAMTGHIVTLEVANAFDVDRLSNDRRRKVVEDIINRALSAEPGTYRVKAVIKGSGGAAKIAISPPPRVREQADATASHSPFLDEVIAVFGGRVLDEPDSKG